MKKNKNEIMILGLTPAGLFLLRELSRSGKNVLAVGLKDNIGLYSKYGHKICLSKIEEVEDVINKYFHPDVTTYICSDPFINYLLDKNHKILKEKKCFPDYKSAKIFSDKLLTGQLADTLGIAYPKMYSLSNVTNDNIKKYPLILKWNRRKTFNEPFKTIIINSKYELERISKNYKRFHNNLIVQKYIRDECTVNISYGGYYLHGNEKMHIIVLQKRQYPKGITCFAEEYKGKYYQKIWEISKKIISNIEFNGFAEVEFRVDIIKNKIYLIEVNPRTWGWIKVLKKKYKKLDLDFIQNNIILNENSVCSTNIVRDTRAIINMLKTNPDIRILRSVIDDYRKKPIMDIFETNDLKPFFMQFRKIFK